MVTKNAKLVRAEKKKSEATKVANKFKQKMVNFHIENALMSSASFRALQKQEVKLRSSRHFARSRVSKQTKAIAAREELLREMKAELKANIEDESQASARLEELLQQMQQIRDEITATVVSHIELINQEIATHVTPSTHQHA